MAKAAIPQHVTANAFDALHGMTRIEHKGEMQHAGWSIWISQIEGHEHRTVDAWRQHPYQVHRVDMPNATPGRVKAWVETLVIEAESGSEGASDTARALVINERESRYA